MPDTWEAFRYIRYVRRRWRVVAGSCLVALVLAAGISYLMPREYSATTRILIEPPAGADARSAMAVSPVYLESLKTYEEFAASDSLFEKAAELFNLRQQMGAIPIEAMKKRVLRVGVVRNTRILEIRVTLPNPTKAQALAEYLAEQAVTLNQSLTAQSGHDLIDGIVKQEQDAKARLAASDAESTRIASAEPVDDLQNAIYQASEQRARLEQQITALRLDLVDTTGAGQPGRLRTRLEELQKQLEALNQDTAAKEKLLNARLSHREQLDAQRKADQTALADVETQLRTARDSNNYRGDRLTVIDRGVVPEQPSSPNVPLNLAAALLFGLLLPMVWLAFELSFQQQRVEAHRSGLPSLARIGDD